MKDAVTLVEHPQRYRAVLDGLLGTWGAQGWWPADTAFEVMVGAILTQNTAWTNVEKAIANLRQAQLLHAQGMLDCEVDMLAECLRPSGYFNIKARRLRAFCRWYLDAGGIEALRKRDTQDLRSALLAVHGIGPETADDMLLYAFDRPVFVIDSYTRRVFTRLGLIGGTPDYETLRRHIESQMEEGPESKSERVALWQEFHALIVHHCKQHCRSKPACEACGLAPECDYAHNNVHG